MTSEFNLKVGRTHIREARSQATSARLALAAGDPSAESFARQALKSFWSAMNWLEGSEEFDTAHDELHEVGRYTRENFASGCELPETEDGNFLQRCAVPLAHKRFGMSIGATGNAICSICGDDASECPHMPGRRYEVPAEVVDGRCSICSKNGCRLHQAGVVFETEARVIVTEAELHEVSIVDRPFQPDARITEIPVSRSTIEHRYGTRLPRGTLVTCDNCLSECGGLQYLGESE